MSEKFTQGPCEVTGATDSPEWAFRAVEMINDLQQRVYELEKGVAYLEYCQNEESYSRSRE